jgi:hypothetical protein
MNKGDNNGLLSNGQGSLTVAVAVPPGVSQLEYRPATPSSAKEDARSIGRLTGIAVSRGGTSSPMQCQLALLAVGSIEHIASSFD